MKRKASAEWKGSLKEGNGSVSMESGVLSKTQYSFGARFESGIGTNPEELVAAAHAACLSMQLSALLVKAGLVPVQIATTAIITLEIWTRDGPSPKAISRSPPPYRGPPRSPLPSWRMRQRPAASCQGF